MKASPHKFLPVLCIILFSIGLRIYAPTADLPPDISFSGSIYTDEGNQCHNSRSRILYGDGYPDDWRISLYSPFTPHFQYWIFKLFGVGLVQERLVSYIFAFFSILVFYGLLKSHFGFAFTVLGTLFFGINFFLVMYSKIGTFETPMIFWMILSLYFIEKFRSRNNLFCLTLSAMAAFMAFVFKNLAGYFIPVPVLAVFIWVFMSSRQKPLLWKESMKPIFYILLGVGLALLLWYIFFYIPNQKWILGVPGQYISNQVLPKSLGQAWQNFYGFNWKEQFYKIPVVWFLSILSIPLFFRNLVRKKLNITELGFFLFFLFHTGFFMFMNHRPTRYLIPVIPAMIFMTLVFGDRILGRSARLPFRYSPLQKGLVFFLDIIWLSLAASFCFFPLYERYVHPIRIPPFSILNFIFSALVILLGYALVKIFRKFKAEKIQSIAGHIAFPFVLLCAALSIAADIGHYLEWNRDKTHTVYEMSRELGEKLDDAYIAGLTAPVAVLENRHRSLFLFPGFVNWDENTLEKYPLTHALLASFNQEISSFFRQWPERMKKARLLRVYNVKDQFLHLYSLDDPSITGVERKENDHLRFRIQNPGNQPIETGIGSVSIFRDNGSDGDRPGGYSVEKINGNFVLAPGENPIDLKTTREGRSVPVSVLFFLERDKPVNGFRYEAEKFPQKVGTNKRDPKSSAGFSRSFSQKKHKPGYLSFGPFVPFSEGFLEIDFYLQCSRIRSRIKPVIRLDIFSYGDKKSLANRVLKSADLVRDQYAHYRLSSVVSGVRYLEFRVYAEGLSDIDFDYVDMVYYQGFLLGAAGSAEGSSGLLKRP